MDCYAPIGEGPLPSHAIMLHHFHGGIHPAVQGSISGEEFAAMIAFLRRDYTILGAREYMERALAGELSPRDTCITFDDALRCQTDIALPVLAREGISAFFFIYSSPLCGEPDWLEVFRYYRTTQFSDIDAFYEAFNALMKAQHGAEYEAARAGFSAAETIAKFPHYSESDVWFRHLRDHVLGKARYEAMMHEMMKQSGFDASAILPLLWMNDAEVKALEDAGHMVGLHSYSHPTTIDLLSRAEQEDEYRKNMAHLTRVLGKAPDTMSHPCGRYSAVTLDILKGMGVTFGFRSNLSSEHGGSALEIPRRDHAAVLKAMRAA